MGDKLSYSEIQTIIANMRTYGEEMKTNLTGCNNLVKEDVNTGKGIWDGASASQFATKFDALSDQIPTLLQSVFTQADLLEAALKKIAEADGTVAEASTGGGGGSRFSTVAMK